MKLAAVLFDVSDTLIELAEDVGVTYSRVASRHGVNVPPSQLSRAFGQIIVEAEDRVFPGLSLDEIPGAERAWWEERVRETFEIAEHSERFADFDRFFAELFDVYGGARGWRLREQALPALERTRDLGLRIGVVSNFDFRLPGVLQDLGIQGFMDTTVLPANCGAAKPSPRIFEAAVSELGLTAAECVYVGHDPALDIAGAREAGMRTLTVDSPVPGLSLSARIEGLAKMDP